ncbi:zinc finger CCCH-type antiviral protein 1-like isoform X3 [Prinia subflava]|uniref:zinc finger CCCH-type antiviral protein 1-like isoform X3 n=1 Tax=Prinia subflava TaxID=208062 RepID=UPI002FE2CB68
MFRRPPGWADACAQRGRNRGPRPCLRFRFPSSAAQRRCRVPAPLLLRFPLPPAAAAVPPAVPSRSEGTMCDPAVSSFLTQTLCAHGGRLGLRELEETVGLPAPQLQGTLRAAGPRRFLVLEGGPAVVAVTDARVCVLKECGGCERLHLCKLHLMGRCHLGPSSCKYSHDIMNAENKKVLKKYDLSGLSENELQVLLLQNDPFFLPDTCHFYNKKGCHCTHQSNCNKLHVCRFFLLGKCKFPQCVMSHNLLDSHGLRLLESGGIDGKIASNFQAICDYKHLEFNREQKKGYVHNYRPRHDNWKKPAVTRNKELNKTLQTVESVPHVPPAKGPSSTAPAQSQHQLPTGVEDKDKDKGNENGFASRTVVSTSLPSSTAPAQSQDQLPTAIGNKDKGNENGFASRTVVSTSFPSSTAPAQSQDQLPTGVGNKDKGNENGFASRTVVSTSLPSSTAPAQSQDQLPTAIGNKGKGNENGFASRTVVSTSPPSSTAPAQSQDQLPTGVGNKDKGKKNSSSDEDSKDNKKDNSDEICLFYVWKYCKNKDKCKSVHYHLPYKWEIYDGLNWHELPLMEEIEKAYCDPKNSSLPSTNIDFQKMTCSSSLVRRLSTPSSVTKPTFLLTTQWIWYWKNNQDKWIEYGEQEEGSSMTSPSSAIIENLYQADPCAVVPFQTDQHQYELNFKEMIQTNIIFKTRRQICRRPKFVSSEEVQKIKTSSQRDPSSIPSQTCPSHWDASALPDFGYKAVVISSETSEYNGIKQLFHQTMKNYSILKIQRIQNPSLWKVFQWQKEKMKRENGGKEVQEKQLFHGTDTTSMKMVCTQNFDWRICGSNGSNYGKGSYFARDARYAHAYCQATAQGRLMFVARVLVGDYVRGNAAYVRPPEKSADKMWFYDSCVDDELNPSVFVVFEKHQIYPEYIIEYEKERITEQKETRVKMYWREGIRQQNEAGIGVYGAEGEIRMYKEEGIRECKDDRKKCVIS